MSDFPLSPAPAGTPPPMPHQAVAEPAAVRVFGILHLVLATIGLFGGLWSIFSTQLTHLILDRQDLQEHAQLRYAEEIRWVSTMNGAFMLALALPLTLAGLKLVHSRPEGVVWSHRYAWTSIATKLVSLVVTVVVVLPATRRMMADIMAEAPALRGAAEQTFTTVVQAITAITSVATPILSCLYPALALFFLSRPAVKEWAARPR